MKRTCLAICIVLTAVAGPASAQEASGLNGVWTFNRPASDLAKEIGFTPAWLSQAGGGEPGTAPGGGRGRRGGGAGGGENRSGGAFQRPRDNYEDARRVQLLTSEARNPTARLMIVDTPEAVTITNELGQARTLHPNGREEAIQVEGVSVPVTATREPGQLVVVYHVEQDRDVRCTYARSPGAPQLIVDVQFLEHGAGDKERLVYDAGVATEPAAPAAGAGSRPASGAPAPETFDERPGAELKGIKTLGILVEDLGASAVACGLNRDALEDALAKRLAGGGFDVRKNSDEDTYVYVNVITNTLPGGTCVSRYDTFLYTHATANLSYRDRPVLVQVSLMHRGGIGASAPAAHAAAVTRGLEGYVDLLMTQIRDANR